MPNDQMTNYGVQTQYVLIKSTSQKRKQIRENHCSSQRRKEIREQKSREEKKRKDKKKRRKNKRKKKKREEKKKEEKKGEEKQNIREEKQEKIDCGKRELTFYRRL